MRRVLVGLTAAWFAYTILNLIVGGRWALWLLPNLLPPLVFAGIPVVLAGGALAVRGARRPVGILSAGALLLGFGQAGLNPAALWPGDDPVPAGAVKVVAWNTEVWHLTDDPDRLFTRLRDENADLYLLQEYQPADLAMTSPLAPIDTALIERYLPGYTVVAAGELLTLSRLPVVASRPLPSLPPAGSRWLDAYHATKSLRVDVQLGAQVVSLYNVHVPVPLDLGQSVLSAGFYATVGERWDQRQVQWRALAADLSTNPNPVLLAGDLNSTASMGELRHLPATLRPAQGDDFVPVSWNGAWRLDWLFTTAGLTAHRYTLDDTPGLSDHRAQTAYLTANRTAS